MEKKQKVIALTIVMVVSLGVVGGSVILFGGVTDDPSTTDEGFDAGEVAERGIVSMSNAGSYAYVAEVEVEDEYVDEAENDTIATSEDVLISNSSVTHNAEQYRSSYFVDDNGNVNVREYYTDGETDYVQVAGNWNVDEDAPDRYYTESYAAFEWDNATLDEGEQTVTLTLTEADVNPDDVADMFFDVSRDNVRGDTEFVSQDIEVTATFDKSERYVESLTIDMAYERQNDRDTQSTVTREMVVTIDYDEHGTTTVSSPTLFV